MKGIIRANVDLPGLSRGEEAEVEVDDYVTRRAANGSVTIVWTEGGDPTLERTRELEDLTVEELGEVARAHELTGWSDLRKEELVDFIREQTSPETSERADDDAG